MGITMPNPLPRVLPNPDFGRIPIYTDEVEITAQNLLQVLSDSLVVFRMNQNRVNFLWNYYRGNTPILNREKTHRPEINSKVNESRANEIVSFKTGYLLGEPMQYIAREGDDGVSENIEQLNGYMMMEDKAAKDKELADWFYISGTAYRMALPNADPDDENPFHIYTLSPLDTFIVHSSGLGHEPMMGVKELVKRNGDTLYSVYTKDALFEIENGEIVNITPHRLGMIPIIEYPANSPRLGAFEIVISLLDAINEVDSDRLDGVEQFVQSFFKFVNCDIDEEQFQALKDLGAIKIKNVDGQNADVDIITQELNQTQTQTLKDDLIHAVLEICGMPNRNGGRSTSDTGTAVIFRDGWSSAEARAKDTESMFKRSERKFLKLVLKICEDTTDLDLKVSQVEMKFTRRNYSDILTKSQVLTTMLDNPKIHPELAFAYCGMFVDSEAAYKKSDEYYKQYLDEMKESMMQEDDSNGEDTVRNSGQAAEKTEERDQRRV